VHPTGHGYSDALCHAYNDIHCGICSDTPLYHMQRLPVARAGARAATSTLSAEARYLHCDISQCIPGQSLGWEWESVAKP